MPVCVPVRDMKDTAKFAALVESEREVTVTKNGYSAIHCLSEDEWRVQQEEVAKARLLSRILLAEQEEAAGDFVEFDAFTAQVRDQYGL
jgi:PHD/YefM family antitoxin component YafN of YafNO toxin-antitoxin module